MNDPTCIAAADLLDELGRLAREAAGVLRGKAELPPLVIGQLLVASNKPLTRLARHADRLQPVIPDVKG